MAFITGLASGIDTNELIQQLLAIERRPVTLMRSRQSTLELKRDAYRDVNTRLDNLISKLDALISPSAFQTRTVTSSGAGVVTATASTSAAVGSYDVVVSQLARVHRVASDPQADASSALDLAGVVSINGVDVEITADMSLSAIRDAINDAGAGVTASILNNTLVLESKATGTANSIQLIDAGGPPVVNATSTDDAVVSVSAGDSAEEGAYNIAVTALATQHQARGGNSIADPSAALGFSGTFAINGVYVTVDTADSLNDIVDRINASGAGVTASLDGSNRLVVTSDAWGAAGQLVIEDIVGDVMTDDGKLNLLRNDGEWEEELVQARDAEFTINGVQHTSPDNVVDDVIAGVTLELKDTSAATVLVTRTFGGGPLADLGLLDSSGFVKNELQSAQDAAFSINGVDFVRSSNSVNDAVSGVSFTFAATGSASVTIGRDVQGAVSKVRAFVDQYNSTLGFIQEKIAKGAILQGDPTLIRLQSNLRLQVMDRVNMPDGSTYNALSQVGISIDKSGVMTLNTAKLQEAIENHPDEVQQLFAASADNEGFEGVATRLREYARSYAASGSGILSSRRQMFDEQIKSLKESMDRIEQRLAIREEHLVREFTEMEKALSEMQSLGVTLAGQIAGLMTFWGSRG